MTGITSRAFPEAKPRTLTPVPLNVRGPFFCAQHAASNMLRVRSRRRRFAALQRRDLQYELDPRLCWLCDHSIYDGTNGAIFAMTRVMAVELGPLGIRVNGIAPGGLSSTVNQQIRDFDPGDIGRRSGAMASAGQPIEVARACVYFASDVADLWLGISLSLWRCDSQVRCRSNRLTPSGRHRSRVR